MLLLPVPPGGVVLGLHGVCDNPPQLWVDGAVKQGRVSGGALWRAQGEQIELSWLFSVSSRDSTLAELLALLAALQSLKSGALQGAVIYTDSYQLLEHLNRYLQSGTCRYPEAHRVLSLLDEHGVGRLQNIERRRNKQADALAKKELLARGC